MSYYTGTINDANPATSVMNTLRPLIDAHPAWVHVETVTSGTNVADVYRCLGTVNSFGTDFHVIIARSSGTVMGIGIGEGPYDAATKTLGKVGPLTAVAGVAIETNFSYATARHVANENTTVAATTGFIRCSGGQTERSRTLTASSNQQYFLSITNDRIVFSILFAGNSTWHPVYAGLYDSFHSTTVDPFPLYCGHPGTGAVTVNEHGVFTREVLGGGSPLYGFMGGNHRLWTPNPWGGVAGNTASMREAITGRYWPSRIPLGSLLNTRALRGLLKADVVGLVMGDITEAPGDVMTIDGVQYVCIVANDSHSFVNTSGAATNAVSSTWVSTAA